MLKCAVTMYSMFSFIRKNRDQKALTKLSCALHAELDYTVSQGCASWDF